MLSAKGGYNEEKRFYTSNGHHFNDDYINPFNHITDIFNDNKNDKQTPIKKYK